MRQNRHKETFPVAIIPAQTEPEERGFRSCCCEFIALASVTDSVSWKNDFRGCYIKKSSPGDSVTFEVTKCETGIVSNMGYSVTFPQDTLVEAFVFEWRQYLIATGAGKYSITANYTIGGISGSKDFGTYTLRPYSFITAAGTVRIRSVFDSYLLSERIDFTYSNFTDCVRFRGFIGDETPGAVINDHYDQNRTKNKSTREDIIKLQLKSDPLQICLTSRIVKFHLLNQDQMFVSDHNAFNHDKTILDRPVSITEYDQVPIQYSDMAYVNATFGDKTVLQKSQFNK